MRAYKRYRRTMPKIPVSLVNDSTSSTTTDKTRVIVDAFSALRQEMAIPADFPAEVTEQAEGIVENLAGKDPAENWPNHTTQSLEIPFITIDPEGSMDLDQALHISEADSGFVVHYAIADVAAFVEPGSPIDVEARKRGTTLYAPDWRTPLHPPQLSEGTASLLPEVVRPAAVWTIVLDQTGEFTSMEVSRGLVRSRTRFSYVQAQLLLDDPANLDVAAALPADYVGLDTIQLLGKVGPLRQKIERARGGVSLNVPEQEVHVTQAGDFELSFRTVLPVENYNAQISLLTGMCAAQLMLRGGVGVLRTLPQADPRDLARLRRTASALKLSWHKELSYGDFLATLDAHNPRHIAFQFEATTLFRGADYLAFSTDPRQTHPVDQEGGNLLGSAEEAASDAGKQCAIGAHYAHVTAPLRRLGDRFTTEICLAVSTGVDVPLWVIEALPFVPQWLNAASRHGNAYTRSTTDIVEAALLQGRVGETFEGAIVDVDDRKNTRGDAMIVEPAVHADVRGTEPLPLGETVLLTLVEADIKTRKIKFQYGN